jgi:hypothetical protein
LTQLLAAFIGQLISKIIVFQAQLPVFHLRRSTETAAKTVIIVFQAQVLVSARGGQLRLIPVQNFNYRLCIAE